VYQICTRQPLPYTDIRLQTLAMQILAAHIAELWRRQLTMEDDLDILRASYSYNLFILKVIVRQELVELIVRHDDGFALGRHGGRKRQERRVKGCGSVCVDGG
jgi:hypothetical protein